MVLLLLYRTRLLCVYYYPHFTHGKSILTEVGLSWDHLHTNSCKEVWTELVQDAITAAVDRERVAAASRHGLYPGYARLGTRVQRLTGDLVCAVLRFRAPCLRLLPSYDVRDHGQCRICRSGDETGAHLLYCSHLPPQHAAARDDLLSLASHCLTKSSMPLPDYRTCEGRSEFLPYFLDLDLSSALKKSLGVCEDRDEIETRLIKRIAVLYRDLLKSYASLRPDWEPVALQAYPVLRPRPLPATLFFQFLQSRTVDLVDPS